MKKLPYEKFIKYLILARNPYTNIVAYVKAYKFGKINGHALRKLEGQFVRASDIDELSYLESTRVLKAPKQGKGKPIGINLIIPNELSKMATTLGLLNSPFKNASVKFIVENIMLRRALEVYLTTKMDMGEICKLINNRFRIELKDADIEYYEDWMYNLENMAPDNIYKYFASLDTDEQDYKYMAFMKKEDYVKWKMGDDCDIDPKAETMKMMVDSLHSFKECISQNPPHHAAAKVWSDIYFKCMDHLASGDGTKDAQVFAKFQFNMVKDKTKKPILFSELLEKNK